MLGAKLFIQQIAYRQGFTAPCQEALQVFLSTTTWLHKASRSTEISRNTSNQVLCPLGFSPVYSHGQEWPQKFLKQKKVPSLDYLSQFVPWGNLESPVYLSIHVFRLKYEGRRRLKKNLFWLFKLKQIVSIKENVTSIKKEIQSNKKVFQCKINWDQKTFFKKLKTFLWIEVISTGWRSWIILMSRHLCLYYYIPKKYNFHPKTFTSVKKNSIK